MPIGGASDWFAGYRAHRDGASMAFPDAEPVPRNDRRPISAVGGD